MELSILEAIQIIKNSNPNLANVSISISGVAVKTVNDQPKFDFFGLLNAALNPDKIQAIKAVRAIFHKQGIHVGLADSKMFVEDLKEKVRAPQCGS